MVLGHLHQVVAFRDLECEGFGTDLDATALLELRVAEDLPQTVRIERLKNLLSKTATGLYDVLKNFYLRAGEGRVDCVKSIIAADRLGYRKANR